MTETIQIVRPAPDGEPLPFYSTADLLLGVRHVVPVPRPQKPEPITTQPPDPSPRRQPQAQVPTPARIHRVKGQAKAERYQAKWLAIRGSVREMLIARHPRVEIAKAHGVSKGWLINKILQDPELAQIRKCRKQPARRKLQAERAKVGRMLRGNKTVRQIAEVIGVGRNSCHMFIAADEELRSMMRTR